MDGIAGAQELQAKLSDSFFLDDLDLVDRLFPSLSSGVHWGLERTEKSLKSLGLIPQLFRQGLSLKT